MIFIIETKQTKKGHYIPRTDMGFSIMYACENRDDLIAIPDFEPSPYSKLDPKNIRIIPVGSIDFVHRFILNHYGKKYVPKPLLTPDELTPYLGREIKYMQKAEIPKEGNYFIKSATKLKTDNLPTFTALNIDSLEEDLYLVSEVIEIQSEHRCFVHNARLIDIRTYSDDDFITLPDVDVIKEIITKFKDAPTAYTIDVAVLEDGSTVIIELHHFYSVGLYGMQDNEKVAIMASQWMHEHLRKTI